MVAIAAIVVSAPLASCKDTIISPDQLPAAAQAFIKEHYGYEIELGNDLDEARKKALLQDALAYLDGKGYFSFRLHSLVGA